MRVCVYTCMCVCTHDIILRVCLRVLVYLHVYAMYVMFEAYKNVFHYARKACCVGVIYLHCYTSNSGRSFLEDPPSISEGCGGRVTDYRINVLLA